MEWIKAIIEKHKTEDGTYNIEEAMQEINQEFPKNAVPKETYNNLASEKKQLDLDIASKDTQIEEFQKLDVEALQQEAEKYKLENLKINIASQANIPLELAGRLSGSTEEEIKADAEKLAGFVNKKQPLPLKPTEPTVDDKDAGLKNMLSNMNKQN